MFDYLSQSVQPPLNEGLDRSRSAAQGFGDFRLGETCPVAKYERGPLAVRKLQEDVHQLRRLTRHWGRLGRGQLRSAFPGLASLRIPTQCGGVDNAAWRPNVLVQAVSGFELSA